MGWYDILNMNQFEIRKTMKDFKKKNSKLFKNEDSN